MMLLSTANHKIILFIICYLFTKLHGEFFQHVYTGIVSRNNNMEKSKKVHLSFSPSLHKVTKLRGGSDNIAEIVTDKPCAILVSTSVGSVFLDKKKRLSIDRNATIAELKLMIEKKFPGCPPVPLQKLFLGVRPLGDEEVIGNITITSPTPILLDMMSGTSVYNKTLSISQALEAHAASIVQQVYLGSKMKSVFTNPTNPSHNLSPNPTINGNETTSVLELESSVYRDMFDDALKTLYETYSEDIAEALEREKEPETLTEDTVAWRGKQAETKPLTAALAKEFDLNMRGIRNFFYYSILLGVSLVMIRVKVRIRVPRVI
jgi:hypothetical protein